MDINNGGGGTLRRPPSRHKNKTLLFDITIVNPCASSNLENAAHDAGERKKTKYGGSFLATCSLPPFDVLMGHEVDSEGHALIKELAIRWVENRSETYSNRSSTSSAAVIFYLTASSCIPHASPSLQRGGGTYEHPTAPFTRPRVCTRTSYQGGNRVRGPERSKRDRGRDRRQGQQRRRERNRAREHGRSGNENGGIGERRSAVWEQGLERGRGGNGNGDGGEDPWTNTRWEQGREQGWKLER